MASPAQNPRQILDTAIKLHQAGQLENAKQLYHNLLRAHPNHAATLHMLGLAEMQTGDPQTAIVNIKKALALEPRNASFAGNLGVAYKAAGETEKAITAYRAALTIDPALAPLHNNLGVALQETEDHASACDCFRKALSYNRNYPEAEANLGISLTQMGDLKGAIGHFHRAVKLNPTYANAHQKLALAYREAGLLHLCIEHFQTVAKLQPTVEHFLQLGDALFEDDRFDQAIEAFASALAKQPGTSDILIRLARAKAKRGHMNEAADLYRKAIKQGDQRPSTLFALAGVLLDSGQQQEALQTYRDVLSADPDFSPAQRMLAFANRWREENEDTKSIRAAFDRAELQSPQRMHLGFALGKIEEDFGHHENAFAHFSEANFLHRQTLTYNPDDTRQRAEGVMRLFNQSMFDRHSEAGLRGEGPLFILGMPRSGTSLTEQILSAHPGVHGAGELRLISSILLEAGLAESELMFSSTLSDLPDTGFADLGKSYLARTRPLAPDARFISNKMPGNFWRIGLIRLMLPDAKIINCRRNPADNCLSIFKNYFSVDGHRYAYELAELGAYYATYRRLMSHWHKVLPGFIYDVDYENLVTDQESESRRLLDWLGLDWNDAVLSFHNSDRAVKTASAAQVRRPIYSDSIRLADRYGKALQPLLDALADQD